MKETRSLTVNSIVNILHSMNEKQFHSRAKGSVVIIPVPTKCIRLIKSISIYMQYDCHKQWRRNCLFIYTKNWRQPEVIFGKRPGFGYVEFLREVGGFRSNLKILKLFESRASASTCTPSKKLRKKWFLWNKKCIYPSLTNSTHTSTHSPTYLPTQQWKKKYAIGYEQ